MRLGVGLWLALVLAVPAFADPPPPPSPPPATTVSELVARYDAWRGGDAYRALTSIHETASLDAPTGRQTLEIWLLRDGRSRSDNTSSGFTLVQATTPKGAWEINQSGQSIEQPTSFETDRRYAALLFGDALDGRAGATLRLAGTATIDGRGMPIVSASFGDADSYDVVIDPVTGALCCFRITEKGVTQLQLFGDWRMVDGVRMPFAQEVRSDQPTRVIFTTIDLNRPADPALFERPAGARRAAFAGGADSSGWLGFELYAGSQIYFPAKVNGHPANALLDSGATASLVDTAFAASAGLAPTGKLAVAGATAMSSSQFAGGVSIQAGALTLGPLTTAAIDFAPIARLDGHATPLVVGDDAFNELAVDIDFAARRLAFRAPAAVSPPAGAIAVPLEPGYRVRLSVEGQPPAAFLVDLGDSDTLELTPDYAKASGLAGGGRVIAPKLGVGVGGESVDGVGVVKQVQIGGVTLTNVPVVFDAARQPGSDDDVAGRVGMGLLTRFHLIVDAPQHRLYLAPDAAAMARPFEKDRLGLSLEPDGDALLVKVVAAASPAGRAGFKVGDRIVAIDGKPAAGWTYATLKALEDRPAGAKVAITRAAGPAATVTLADYY